MLIVLSEPEVVAIIWKWFSHECVFGFWLMVVCIGFVPFFRRKLVYEKVSVV